MIGLIILVACGVGVILIAAGLCYVERHTIPPVIGSALSKDVRGSVEIICDDCFWSKGVTTILDGRCCLCGGDSWTLADRSETRALGRFDRYLA